MQHWILRCEHCNSEYVFCTHGNGAEHGTHPYCTRHYCGECGKAVAEALNKIPVKVRMQFTEIEFDEKLYNVLKDIEKEHDIERKKSMWPEVVRIEAIFTYDEEKEYVYRNTTYRICKTQEGDIVMLKGVEYDMVNNVLTDKRYFTEGSDRYVPIHGCIKNYKKN